MNIINAQNFKELEAHIPKSSLFLCLIGEQGIWSYASIVKQLKLPYGSGVIGAELNKLSRMAGITLFRPCFPGVIMYLTEAGKLKKSYVLEQIKQHIIFNNDIAIMKLEQKHDSLRQKGKKLREQLNLCSPRIHQDLIAAGERVSAIEEIKGDALISYLPLYSYTL